MKTSPQEIESFRTEIDLDKTDWQRIWPFVAIHIAALAVFYVGYSATALWICAISYLIRMFSITGFFHRYFSHKTFKTSRVVQFIFALIGTAATQRGPIWWAAHHRHHHRHSDTEADIHSPNKGFWQSHCGWFLTVKGYDAPYELIKDFQKYPELRWLDNNDIWVAVGYGLGLFALGEIIGNLWPTTGINGLQCFVWGYLISTLLVIHATLSINSLAHRWGTRPYSTKDQSRNNFLLAIITLGEGWHNNHHHYAGSTRQGFTWWQIDLTFYLLKIMQWMGLVWDLKPVPANKLAQTGSSTVRSLSS